MFHPAVPARVAATIPDVSLIALLRDPVERAYSHYQMMSRTGREKLGFEEALAAEPERLAGVEEALMANEEILLPSGYRATTSTATARTSPAASTPSSWSAGSSTSLASSSSSSRRRTCSPSRPGSTRRCSPS